MNPAGGRPYGSSNVGRQRGPAPGAPQGGPAGPSPYRNNAAKEAQRRLQKMMATSQDDDEIDPPYTRPPPPAQNVARPSAGYSRPAAGVAPPLAMPVGGGGRQHMQGPPSSDSGSTYSGYSDRDRFPDSGRRRGLEPEVGPTEAEMLKREAAKLRDDNDELAEENDYLLDKLRMAEEELKETQARAHELEKQVASLGEGATFEARLITRKEAALKQREAALKAAKEQSRDVNEAEIDQLRLEAEAAKEEAVTESEKARAALEEMRQLRSLTQRMVLTPPEKEEVVLKRCWLARYWLLAAQHGVHGEVAGQQSEHWHKLAPLPLEVVIAAGQKAKEEPRWDSFENGSADAGRDVKDISASADSNIESMFQVERGLRDLAALKVEEGVLLAMAQHRRPPLLRVGQQAPPATPADGPRNAETLDLSEEEVEDVQFKQNWLVYFWRRAKTHNVESEIARERLQYWINRTNFRPTAHDAVDAERGLGEMRKLGLEQKLWEAGRAHLADDMAAARTVATHRRTGSLDSAHPPPHPPLTPPHR